MFRGAVMKDDRPCFCGTTLTITEQADLLLARGLALGTSSRNDLESLLLHCNFHRLKGYWEKYYIGLHDFSGRLTLERLVRDYEADALLRSVLLSALGTIEITFRSIFAHVIASKYGPFPYSAECFRVGEQKHIMIIEHLKHDLELSRDPLVEDFRKRFSNPIPPVWIMVEIMSMGEMSKWFREWLHKNDRIEIASYFAMHYPVVESWMQMFSIARNRCAHHARLYGVLLKGGMRIPRSMGIPEYIGLFAPDDRHGLYNVIIAVSYILDIMGNHSQTVAMLEQVGQITRRFELDERHLGFPYGMSIEKTIGILA